MVLDATDHQEDANWNHKEMSPHTCQNGCRQEDKKQRVLATTWRPGNSMRENNVENNLLKILETESSYHLATPLLGTCPKEMKTGYRKDIPVHCSIFHNSQDVETNHTYPSG